MDDHTRAQLCMYRYEKDLPCDRMLESFLKIIIIDPKYVTSERGILGLGSNYYERVYSVLIRLGLNDLKVTIDFHNAVVN